MAVKTVNLVDFGRVLATRDLGREVAARIAEFASDEPSLVLSFRDVEAVAPPFLNEIFEVIYGGLESARAPWTAAVSDLDDDVRETLRLVLDYYKLSIAELAEEGSLGLLTSVPQLEETLAAAQALGDSFTAPELAERLDQKLPNINQRLSQLVEARALAREPDRSATRGRRYRYRTAAHGQATLPTPA